MRAFVSATDARLGPVASLRFLLLGRDEPVRFRHSLACEIVNECTLRARVNTPDDLLDFFAG